jgi:hypothetical protein
LIDPLAQDGLRQRTFRMKHKKRNVAFDLFRPSGGLKGSVGINPAAVDLPEHGAATGAGARKLNTPSPGVLSVEHVWESKYNVHPVAASRLEAREVFPLHGDRASPFARKSHECGTS